MAVEIRLKEIISEEAALLTRFSALQEELREIVGNRQWAELEKTIAVLQVLSERIEELEQSRLESFRLLQRSVGAKAEDGFSQVVSRLKEPERQELLDFYRKLKIAVIRLKGSSGSLGYYVRSLSNSISRVLEELLPYRKGRLYSRSGRTKAAGSESIVVDRKL